MPMIKLSNTAFYDDYARSKTGSVQDFLTGTTMEQLGVAKGLEVRMNMAQRGIAWGQKEADDLVRTLFGKMMNNQSFRQHALACQEMGENPYKSRKWKAPAFLNQVTGQEKSDEDGGRWFSLTDGQQRSFSLRGIMAWSLARGVRMHGGKMDESVFRLLMDKRGGAWVPRADYDQGDLGDAAWKNAKGQRLGAMGYLLAPLAGGLTSDARAMVVSMESRIKEFANLKQFNAQGAHLVRVFNTMDDTLDRMAELEPGVSRETLLNLLTVGALEAMIKVQVLGKDMDAELNVVHSNDTGKGMVEVERIGATLTLFGRGENSDDTTTATAVRTLFNLAEHYGGKGGAADLIKFSFLVSAATSSQDLSFLGLGAKSDENDTKQKFEELLRDAKDPVEMARAISGNLLNSLGAVLLLRKGMDVPELTPYIPQDVKEGMMEYGKSGVRGATGALSWMAINSPDDARKLLPLMELLAGEDLAANSLLSLASGSNTGRMKTNFLDEAVAQWSNSAKAGNGVDHAQALVDKMTVRDNGYGRSNHKQVDELLGILGNNGKGGRNEDGDRALNKRVTNGVFNSRLSSMFRTILGLSAEDVRRGIIIVSGNRTLGLLRGASNDVLLGTRKPTTIDLATDAPKRMHRTASRKVWAVFGGKPKSRNELSLSDIQTLEKRVSKRKGAVEQLLINARERGLSASSLTTLKSRASKVSELLADDRAWKVVSVNAGMIDKIYTRKIHELADEKQVKAIQDAIPETKKRLRV